MKQSRILSYILWLHYILFIGCSMKSSPTDSISSHSANHNSYTLIDQGLDFEGDRRCFYEEDPVQTYVYDFESNGLDGWSGPAQVGIINGQLRLRSSQGYKWHIICDPPVYPAINFYKGTVESDIKPMTGEYCFELKGASSTGSLTWSVYVRFLNNEIFVHQYEKGNRLTIPTGLEYNPGIWYTLQIKFHSQIGQKGIFAIGIKERDSEEPYTLGGKYDYYGQYAQMQGNNQISIGVVDPARGSTEYELYVDNITFNVTE